MPQHVVRLLLLLVAFGALAYGAKRYFTVEHFYQYGHYRGSSVAEIASDKPKYKGTAYCAQCHAAQLAEWANGVHNNRETGSVVKCEVCHGAGGARDVRGMFEASSTGPDHPKNLKLTLPKDSRQLCTLCHERLAGRPLRQPQIVVADHAGTQQCTTCHNPHSPLLNLVSAASSVQPGDAESGKSKAAACAGCHGADGVSAGLPGPSLAGQSAAYLADALKAYGSGARSDPMMSTFAKAANDEDGRDIAAYFASLKCESALDLQKQAALSGKEVASKCVACHGADGVSKNSSWPNLVGQSKAYLLSALKAYKNGSRKNGMMAGIAKELNDVDADNVAGYYANATCK